MPGDTGVVLANNAAFNRRDVEAMLAYYAPDAVVADVRPGGFGEYTGHEAIRAYYGGIFDNTVKLDEAIEVLSSEGGVVVTHCTTHVEVTSDMGSGELTMVYGLRMEMRDGLIERLEVHPDGNAARAARG